MNSESGHAPWPVDTAGGLDAASLRALIDAAARALAASKETINALNVFPVPDGDTGTNMLLTLRHVLDESRSQSSSLADAAGAMSRAALLGARGNSGLILAQFFKGLSAALKNVDRMGSSDLARGLRAAAQAAYASVPDPKEGTMLTVLRECAEEAEEADRSGASLAESLERIAARAMDCVSRTPDMLDVLKRAGVVDSGGFGLAVMLHGAARFMAGRGDEMESLSPPPQAGALAGGTATAPSREFVDAATDEVWGYCTSFAVTGQGLDPDEIRSQISGLGRSAVVAGDDRVIKVHIHVLDPGPAVSYGASLGVLSDVEVKNMDQQAQEWAAARRSGPAPRELPGGQHFEAAVVAVVAGTGMAELFMTTGLGACVTVNGGDSMNPSTQEILSAVEVAPARSVIILPNNRNVIGTAQMVQDLTGKRVRVLPTRSMQAGVAALLSFSPDLALETNIEQMSNAAREIKAGAVSRASRRIELDGKAVEKGAYIGIFEDRITVAAPDPYEALQGLLKDAAREGSVVTVYRGDNTDLWRTEAVIDSLRRSATGLELQVVHGGQPFYEFLISIE